MSEVNLKVPYKSQWDGDAQETVNDCGPSSIAMILSFFGDDQTTDEVFNQTGAGQGLISIAQMQNAISHFGYQSQYVTNVSVHDLQSYLDQGIPVIALVHYGDLQSRQDTGFTGGHFFTVVGYRSDGYFVNDPNFWGQFRQDGDHHFYTNNEFLTAWGNAHLDENPDNSLLVILPKVKPQVTTPSELDTCRVARDFNFKFAQLLSEKLQVNMDEYRLPDNSDFDKEKLLDVFSNKLDELLKAQEQLHTLEQDPPKPIEVPSTQSTPVPTQQPEPLTPPQQAQEAITIEIPQGVVELLKTLGHYIVMAISKMKGGAKK